VPGSLKMTLKVKIRAGRAALLLIAAVAADAGSPHQAFSASVAAGTVAPDAGRASEVAQRAVHLLDYVAVDYSGAVDGGRITSPQEYQEQQTFLTHVNEQLTVLGVAETDPMRAAL